MTLPSSKSTYRALLNSEGQIIGINTAIVSGGVGLGFAIPADTVRRITSDLVTLGYVRRPYLGVSQRGLIALMDVPWLADGLRLSTEVGLLVVTVQPNSPAALAGIHGASQEVIVRNYRVPAGGDVILAFQGKEVNSLQDLAREIDRYKPGDKVAVTILRGNKKTDLPVVLQEAPKQ